MSTRPKIGEFRSAPGNAPRGSMAPSPASEEVAAPPVVETPEAKDTKPEAEIPKTPAEIYRERLERAKIDLNHAHTIYDSVLDKGFYEEYIRIRSKRAVFRTRSYDENLRLQTALERESPRLQMNQEELICRYNLAASLYEWDGKVIPHKTDEDFENVLKMIVGMPAPLVAMLYDQLSKFDAKIMMIFSDGATDSF